MSNLLGDFFTGASMVGGDPDTDANPFHRTILGKTTFSGRLLVVSAHLGATITGKTVITATLVIETHPPLTAEIVGETIITATVAGSQPLEAEIDGQTQITAALTTPVQVYLSASIVGMTRFISPAFAKHKVADFQGTVGAQGERTMTTHGEVLSGTGATFPTPYVDERQPVPHFV